MNTKARKETKRYHTHLYKTTELFSRGTWLEKPGKKLVNIAKKIRNRKNVRVLDLGSGVGRNSIPVAKIIRKNKGKVICVDYLAIADKKLRANAKKHNVEKSVNSHICDVAKFPIKKNYFDLIIAYSILAHIHNKKNMKTVIKRMVCGTKDSGYNFIFLTTELDESDIRTKKKIKPKIEVYLKADEAKKLLKNFYNGWKITTLKIIPYREVIRKGKRKILWKAKYLLFVAKK